MEGREEFRANAAARLREFRLSLGYETAAGFARDIGLPPSKIRRYEQVGFIQGGPLMALVWAIEGKLGKGALSLDWLFDGNNNSPRAPAKRAVRTEGNVIHAAFGSAGAGS